MPRKSKEEIEKLNKTTSTKKRSDKTITKQKSTTTKKADKVTKIADKKVKNPTKSTTSKKATKTASTKSAKKVATKSARSKAKKITTPSIIATEYYDLPFRYNQTIVKILAQTPDTLFIYWDISDMDRNVYVEKYGPDFFRNTRPYLIITNQTMNYTFEVEINDFANSWYLHVNDADCEYRVELGRKFIADSNHPSNPSSLSNHFTPYTANQYLSIISSNEMDMPNNHILFDKLGKSVFFRNVKTNVMSKKDISSISFLQKIGKVYHIYDLYKEFYKDELISDELGFNLPSSNSSSSFM